MALDQSFRHSAKATKKATIAWNRSSTVFLLLLALLVIVWWRALSGS